MPVVYPGTGIAKWFRVTPCGCKSNYSACCGVYGAPSIAEQAPPSYPISRAPVSTSTIPPIGTHVNSFSPKPAQKEPVAVHPVTLKPIFEVPVSAGLVSGQVSTISKQSGTNPAPVPVVGTVSPQVCCAVTGSCAAPKSSLWGGMSLGVFALIIIGIWIFAGVSLRRLV